MPSRRQSCKEKRSQKKENIHESFWELSCCCRKRGVRGRILLFFPRYETGSREVSIHTSVLYVNIRLRRPRQGRRHRPLSWSHYWSHFFWTTAAIKAAVWKWQVYRDESTLLRRKISFKWCTFCGREYNEAQAMSAGFEDSQCYPSVTHYILSCLTCEPFRNENNFLQLWFHIWNTLNCFVRLV